MQNTKIMFFLTPKPQTLITIFVFLVCHLFFVKNVSAQGNGVEKPMLTHVVPPLPEAASLAKYGEIPVNLYTGTPNIDIPLYQINSKELSVPISISYHASGFKVEEASSQVGLGWSLNAGGVITRTIKGGKDEAPSGNRLGYLGLNQTQLTCTDQTLVDEIATGGQDGDPDIFYFNFLGHSGSFNFEKDGTIHFEKDNKMLLLEPTIQSGNITSWLVKDGAGTRYIFNEVETVSQRQVTTSTPSVDVLSSGTAYAPPTFSVSPTTAYDANQNVVNTHDVLISPAIPSSTSFSNSGTSPSTSNGLAEVSNTSWYLSKIISANLSDTIFFEYESDIPTDNVISESISGTNFYVKEFVEKTVNNCGLGTHSQYQFVDYYYMTRTLSEIQVAKRLKSIKSKYEVVEFVKGITRLDRPGTYALGTIRVKQKKNNHIKKEVTFYQSDVLSTEYQDPNYPSYYWHRLQLDSLREAAYRYNSTTPEKNPAYLFTYNNQILPSRVSKEQDHWGYYNDNGQLANGTLMPGSEHLEVSAPFPKYFPGADRSPNASSMDANILTEIQYPTGGKTSFVFEPHTYGKFIENNSIITANEPLYEEESIQVQTTRTANETTFPTTCNLLSSPDETIVPLVITKAQYIEVNSSLKISCVPVLHSKAPQVWIDEIVNGVGQSIYSFKGSSSTQAWETEQEQIWLEPGTYELGARYYFDGDEANMGVVYQKEQKDVHGLTIIEKNKLAGGLRIKQITNHFGNGAPDQVTEYQYHLPTETDRSSGVLLSKPKYLHDQTNYYYFTCGDLEDIHFDMDYHSVSTQSQMALTSTQGSAVAYSVVTEVALGSSSNGKTENYFISPLDYPDITSVYPLFPKLTYDWARGAMDKQVVYNDVGTKLKETEYHYTPQEDFRNKGLIAKKTHDPSVTTTGGGNNDQYECLAYEIISGWMRLDEVVEKNYDPSGNGNFIETSQEYEYNSYHQLRKSIATDHQGKEIIEEKYYPIDYANSNSTVIAKMLSSDWHILSPAIESISKTKIGGSNYILAGSYNDFVFDNSLNSGTGAILPQGLYLTHLAQPLAENSFAKSVNHQAAEKDVNHYERRVHFDQYDNNTNLLSQKLEDGPLTSYLWGYDHNLPIAEVKDADPDEIAFTSFEEKRDDEGGWQFNIDEVTGNAQTGSVYHKLGNSSSSEDLIKSGLDNTQTYEVGFWARTPVGQTSSVQLNSGTSISVSDSWQYYVLTASGTSSINLSNTGLNEVWIDEVRLYPQGAKIRTFVYNELLQLQCVTAHDGRSSYFEYDAFQRHEFTKDHKGNFLQGVKYHYQNQ